MANVKEPYDVALIAPERTHAGIDVNNDDDRWLQHFSDAARFEVFQEDGGPNFEANIFWGDQRLGRLAYAFDEKPGGNVRLEIEKILV